MWLSHIISDLYFSPFTESSSHFSSLWTSPFITIHLSICVTQHIGCPGFFCQKFLVLTYSHCPGQYQVYSQEVTKFHGIILVLFLKVNRLRYKKRLTENV